MTTQKKEPQTATIGDVLERARRDRGHPSQPGTNGGAQLDWDGVNARLAQRLEFVTNYKALETMGDGGGHRDSFGEMTTGLAALITALKSDQAAGRDSSDTMLKLLEYIQQKDEASLREEIREIKDAMAGGGDPTLSVLHELKELGFVGKGDSLLDNIRAMKEIGVLPDQKNGHEPPKSLTQQLQEAVDLVNLLRPAQPAQPASVIQFGDGQKLTLTDYLAIEEFRDRKEQRREEADLSRERLKMGREAFDRMGTAIAEAAAYLIAEEDEQAGPPARRELGERRPPRKGETRNVSAGDPWTTVACDHCGAENHLDLKKRPERFFCGDCGKVNHMEYTSDAKGQPGKDEEAGRPDREDAPSTDIRPVIAGP